MKKKFKVVQVGLGPMGRLIAQLILNRDNLSFKGVVDINPNLIGKNLGELLEIDNDSNIIVESDLNDILLREEIDVIIIATSSSSNLEVM